MKYTDQQLKQALAKMLPEEITLEVRPNETVLWWRHNMTIVKDTELLHLCWLVEEGLEEKDKGYYAEALAQSCVNELDLVTTGWYNSIDLHLDELKDLVHSTWQQRVIALCKVKGVEIV